MPEALAGFNPQYYKEEEHRHSQQPFIAIFYKTIPFSMGLICTLQRSHSFVSEQTHLVVEDKGT
jgi:hypothetical protein